MSNRKPHAKNVPGDFYVVDGCCTACLLPHSVAGEFFGRADEGPNPYDPNLRVTHCYVRQQPVSGDDFEKMALALEVQELDCVRYRGSDRKVIRFLKKRGLGEYVDDAV